jgi:hypothetical protein
MLQVWSGVAQVTLTLPGPGRVEVLAVRRAGAPAPQLLVEAYGADDALVAAGELAVWELNQALASLRAGSSQARRLAVRDDGRGHAGYLDLVCDADDATLYATSGTEPLRAEFRTASATLAADLGTALHHYLTLGRRETARAIVLPDAATDAVPDAAAGPVSPAPVPR